MLKPGTLLTTTEKIKSRYAEMEFVNFDDIEMKINDEVYEGDRFIVAVIVGKTKVLKS